MAKTDIEDRKTMSQDADKPVNVSDLLAAIRNDAAILERFSTRMMECWRGTGSLTEDGSASKDFLDWGNEALDRARHLRALHRQASSLPASLADVSKSLNKTLSES